MTTTRSGWICGKNWWNWRVVNFDTHSSRSVFVANLLYMDANLYELTNKPLEHTPPVISEDPRHNHLRICSEGLLVRSWKIPIFCEKLWNLGEKSQGSWGIFPSPQIHLDHPCWQDRYPSPWHIDIGHDMWLTTHPTNVPRTWTSWTEVDLKQEIGKATSKNISSKIMAKKNSPQLLKLCNQKPQHIQQSYQPHM